MKKEKDLIFKIKELLNSDIKTTVDRKIEEFEDMGKQDDKTLFLELCFCILTANFQAERGIKIHAKIGEGFLTLNENQLAKKLKELGYRFPNTRASYIALAQQYQNKIRKIMESFDQETELRDWLVKNIKGIGMKESSHFLRNTGYRNLAIIDFHILDLLEEHQLISRPKTMTKKKYLEIEEILQNIANLLNLNLAELDLYLWYVETGKIYK